MSEGLLRLAQVADHTGWRIEREKEPKRRGIRRLAKRDFRGTEISGIHVYVPISLINFRASETEAGDLLFWDPTLEVSLR